MTTRQTPASPSPPKISYSTVLSFPLTLYIHVHASIMHSYNPMLDALQDRRNFREGEGWGDTTMAYLVTS